MKSRAMWQMAALLTKAPQPKKPKQRKQWRGSLVELAAHGRSGLRRMQEAKHG